MKNEKNEIIKFCPAGSTFVKAHYKVINGKKHRWNDHCRTVNYRKNIFNKDEIDYIAKQFKGVKFERTKSFSFNVKNGDQYDLLISGWCQFWKNAFNIESNITAEFVKVLMMSESSFAKSATAVTHNSPGQAIGLLQLTDFTLKLIKPDSKEVSDYAFSISREDLFDPNVNIAVGIRWLYRKREIAKAYLKKEPTSLELAEEYKGIRNDKSAKAKKQRETFIRLLHEYENAK